MSMNMQTDALIEKIVKDNKSGSTKIIKKTIELLKKVDKGKRREVLERIRKVFPSMAGLKFIASCIDNMQIEEIAAKIEEMNSKTSDNLSKIVRDKTVTTLSRSHIVERALLSAKKINILESMPAKEGLEMARWLKGRDKEVKVFYDAFMSYATKESDLVVVGADTILKNGFVNKTGTLPLALVAKHFNIEFYVASPSYKTAEKIEFDTLFEFVDKSLVNGVVWENGVEEFDKFVKLVFY